MSVIAKATNSEFKREFLLRGQSRTESCSTGISEMVVQQPEIKQGESYTTPEFGHSNSVRCDQTRRVRSTLPKSDYKWSVEQ